jgi:hypothetical protein
MPHRVSRAERVEIVIGRRGNCRRCGFCCRDCAHLSPKFEGIKPEFYICEIYERRKEFCAQCGQSHEGCVTYPTSPNGFLNPHCGFKFYEQESRAEIIDLIYANWLQENDNDNGTIEK